MLSNKEAQSMRYAQMAHIVTHTHTHTHTINFVYLLWTALWRCLQWVSAFWQGIRRLAGRSGTGRTPATARQASLSISASRRSGCWLSSKELGGTTATEINLALVLLFVEAQRLAVMERSFLSQLMDFTYITIRQITTLWRMLAEVLTTTSTVPDRRTPARGCA